MVLGRYLSTLVQADGPWPSCQGRCAHTHAALRRMLLEGLQAAESVVTRLEQHATVVLHSKACCVFARPVVCSLSQPHTGCSGARAPPSAACPRVFTCLTAFQSLLPSAPGQGYIQ